MLKLWTLVALLGIGSFSLAADALEDRVQFGLNLGLAPNVGTGISAGIALNNMAALAPNVGFGLRADLGLALTNPAVGALGVAPVVTFPIENGGFYVGPSLALGFGGSNASFGLGLRAGAEFDVTQQLMLYTYTGLNITPSITGNTAFGANISISEPLSGMAEARLIYGGGSAAFGFGVGLAYQIF